MKKGCFITSIMIVTIIVGTVLYIFQNHFDNLILTPGKKIITGLVKGELNKTLEQVKDSPEKEELIGKIKEFSENPKVLKMLNEDDINSFVEEIKSAVKDSIIDKSELEEISQLLEFKEK
ncbi:MAG: hypothetical protein HXY50_03985 [Ignavibacteriaceae bacterium]|nr:hypothetical protein [Ignavibacteriaceae bacterium]